MKRLLICFLAILFYAEKGFAQIKGYIDRNTKEFVLVGNLTDHYTVYGYTLPDKKSQKLILISMPPSVEKNPVVYKLGSYNETTNLKTGEKITYVGKKGKFAEMNFIYPHKSFIVFYINERYVDAE